MDLQTMARQLDEIEAEMKRLGLLSDTSQWMPEITSAFGYGQVSFEQWLTGVFLPKARAAIEADELPSTSQVGVAAMRNFDGDDRMNGLVSLVASFDQSVATYTRAHVVRVGSKSSASVGSNWLRRLFRKGG